MEEPDQPDILDYSLKKENRHQVEIEGNEGKFQMEVNPKFKTLNVYDGEGKHMKYSVMKAAQDLVKA